MVVYSEHPLETALAWQAEGRVHVSPAEAATVLHCDPAGLTAAYAHGDLGIPAFKTGRNLKIMVPGLVRLLLGGEDPIRSDTHDDPRDHGEQI